VYYFPYIIFIDKFSLYYNMHKPTKGIYVQPAHLDETDRKRQINILPLTLGPFRAAWEDIVKALEQGVQVTLDDGTNIIICAPCLADIGDMPQQQANASVRYNARIDSAAAIFVMQITVVICGLILPAIAAITTR
jgi:hypothetical protein